MSRLQWEDSAKRSFNRLRKADRDAADMLLDSINLLAGNPRPPGAHPYGHGQFRMRVGFYRVFYTIVSKKPVIIRIEHIGQAPTP